MRCLPSVWFSLISVLLLTLNDSTRSTAGEAVILAQKTDLRTSDKALGFLRRGTLVEVSQTSGTFRLIAVPPALIERDLFGSKYDSAKDGSPAFDSKAKSVQAWVRATDLHEFAATDGVDSARRAIERAKDLENQGHREESCRQYLIAFRLLQRKKGELDEETVAAGISLAWTLVRHSNNDKYSDNTKDGFSLLVNLYARLSHDSAEWRKREADKLMKSIKASVIDKTLQFGDVLRHNEGHIVKQGAEIQLSDGKRIALGGGTGIVVLEPLPDYVLRKAGSTPVEPPQQPEPPPPPDVDSKTTSPVPAQKRSIPTEIERPADGALKLELPNGHVFVRVIKTGIVGMVAEDSIVRRHLADDSIHLQGLPMELLGECKWLHFHQRPLITPLNNDEEFTLRNSIIDLSKLLLGTQLNAFVAQQQLEGPFIDFTKRPARLPALREATETYEMVLHPFDPRLAAAHRQLGIALLENNLEEANTHLQKAYSMRKRLVENFPRIAQKQPSQIHKEFGDSLVDIGDLELTLGDIGPARKHVIEGLSLLRDYHNSSEYTRNTSLSWLAKPLVRRFAALGDVRAAQEIERFYGTNVVPPTLADDDTLNLVTKRTHRTLPKTFQPNEFDEAFALWHSRTTNSSDFSAEMFRAAVPPLSALRNNPEAISGWSVVLYLCGEKERSRQYFRSVPDSILQAGIGEMSGEMKAVFTADVTTSYAAFAAFILSVMNDLEPESIINNALSFSRDMTGRDATSQLRALVNSGDTPDSKFVFSVDDYGVAVMALTLAKRLIALGRADEARVTIDKIEKRLRDEDARKGHRDIEVWTKLSLLGSLLVAVGRSEEGVRRIDQSRHEIHKFATRSLPSLSLREQMNFLTTMYHPQLSRSISTAVNAKAGTSTNVCEWLVNGKARSVETLATQSRYLVDPNGQSEATVKLRAVQWKVASLMTQAESPSIEAQIRVLNERLELLSREVGGAAKPVESRWINQPEFVAAIPEGAAYVDFFRVTDGVDSPIYVSLVAHRGKLTVVDLGAAEPIETLIRETRQLIGKAPQDLRSIGPVEATTQIKEKLARLETLTLGRLQKPLEGAQQLILCPDGPLWLAPWSALYSKTDKKYLIQRYELQFVTSGRSLLSGERQSEEPLGPAVVIADPNYNTKREAAVEPRDAAEETPSEASFVLRSSTAAKQLPPTVINLPGTRSEALAVAPAIERLTGRAPTVFLGDEAVEAACRDVSRPAVLHIAAHGFFLTAPKTGGAAAQHPLLQSGLLFAGYNQRHTGDVVDRNDSVLTALELLGSDFRGTDLVVLSACDTGVGDAQTGEGVLGLRQVFEISGARSIVSTLWSIEDAESARLMKSFYEHLTDSKSKAAALRAAQLERIAAIEERFGAAHPLFWAAYTVTGRPDVKKP